MIAEKKNTTDCEARDATTTSTGPGVVVVKKDVFERIFVPKKAEIEKSPDKNCTFKPRITQFQNSTVFRTEKNPFLRLSRPKKTPVKSSFELEEDEEVFRNAGNKKRFSTPQCSKKRNSMILLDENFEIDSTQTSCIINQTNPGVFGFTETKKRFRSSSFLEKVEESEQLRQQKLQKLRKCFEMKFVPKIDPNSSKIVEREGKKSFLDRLEYQLLKRNEKKMKKREEIMKKLKTTAFPKTNQSFHHVQRRSVADMALDRERTQKFLEAKRKLYLEERMKDATFQPLLCKGTDKIIKASREFCGSHAKPGQIIKGHTETLNRHAAINSLKESEIIEKEKKECTFKPVIKPIPKFIHQIARSFSITKQLEEKKKDANVEKRWTYN